MSVNLQKERKGRVFGIKKNFVRTEIFTGLTRKLRLQNPCVVDAKQQNKTKFKICLDKRFFELQEKKKF